MKKRKRILAGILAASIALSGTLISALAAPQADSGTENGIEVVKDAYKDSYQQYLTTYYANGNPVVIEEVNGATYIHLEDVSDMDQWTKMESKNTAVVAGSKTGETASGKITMNSGTVTWLIGSSSGQGGDHTYVVRNSEITVNGGTVTTIYANYSVNAGNGAHEKCEEQLVENSKITIGGNALTGYVYGCFGYTAIDNLEILIKDNARVAWSLLCGATNGYLKNASVTVDGPGVKIAELAGCQRTLVENLKIELLEGEVTGAISVGSLYNDWESKEGSSRWNWGEKGRFGDIHYGVVKDTGLYIGENFKYQGIWGGFQFMPEEVKAFYEKFKDGDDNVKNILNTYGINEDGEIGTTAKIEIAAAPSADAAGSYKYLGQYGPAGYEGKVPNLLKTSMPGVEVASAPMDITASPSRVSLKKGESKEVQASVSMMAEVNQADGEVVWTSSNEAAVTIVPAEGDSSKAVITGKDIGSAVVTASCTAEGRTAEARITVSVGGDFSVAVSPSVIKMGDTITFTANTNGVASASNADYAWTIDDSAVAEAVENSQNTFKAKAVGAGNASVRAVYTDAYGTESVGTAAFTVEAPKMELKVPETVELGKTFQASAAVTNLSGKAEDLGISVSVSEECDALESLETDGEYMAVDVPTDGDRAVISAYMEYPVGAGMDGQAYAEKNIRITVPKLSGETIYLNTADRKEKTIKAPALIKTLYAHASITEFSVRDEETAEAAYSEEDNSFTVTAGKAGNTVIDAVLPSGTILVSYPVVVTDAAGNADAKDGNTDLILPDMEEIKAPQKPEDVTEEEMDAEFQEAKQSIAGLSGNTAVKENEKAIENLGAAVKANGLLEEGEKVSISLEQQLKDVTFEPMVKRNGDGAVIGLTIAPSRMVYDVTAYKTMLDEEENPIEGTRQLIDLSSDVMKKRMNFQFRFPVPSSVESLYANVEHEGDPVRQYVIENEGGNKFITVTAWHLSDFVLTFTNDRLVSPGGSNRPQSSGAGNSGGSHKDMVTGKTGEWIRDEVGWWFKYDDGTWPAGTWAELGWNNVTNWYYFNADGYMATGWKPDAGNWYYLHPDSDGTQGFMYTGWHEIGGKWYYFSTAAGGPLGAMAAGTTTPDGYKVGTDGAWIP